MKEEQLDEEEIFENCCDDITIEDYFIDPEETDQSTFTINSSQVTASSSQLAVYNKSGYRSLQVSY